VLRPSPGLAAFTDCVKSQCSFSSSSFVLGLVLDFRLISRTTDENEDEDGGLNKVFARPVKSALRTPFSFSFPWKWA